jgi:tyrosyl-tRNA synthetase
LLSFRSIKEIQEFKVSVDEGKNPRDIKFELAIEIVSRFHTKKLADSAKEEFIARFQKGSMPEDIPEHELKTQDGAMGIAHLLKNCGLVDSTSEAYRMIKQGAVKIDGEKIEDRDKQIKSGTAHVYQIGKRRFAKVNLS